MRKLILLLALFCPALLHAQATNYCLNQIYQTFEGGTTGNTPATADLATSSNGGSVPGSWAGDSSGRITYTGSANDMPALVAPGRLCDNITYTNSAGSHGLQLTGDGGLDFDFIQYTFTSTTYTDITASFEYNEDWTTTNGAKIDAFVIGGANDKVIFNAYGLFGGTRFASLECPSDSGKPQPCGTNAAVVYPVGGTGSPNFNWVPSTSCPCKIIMHYGTGNGTTRGQHWMIILDKNGLLLAAWQAQSFLAYDPPQYVKVGDMQNGNTVETGHHSFWDNVQFSASTDIPGQFCKGASPTWTTSPDNYTVASVIATGTMQGCLTGAAAGDTVNVLPGTATWNNVQVNDVNGANIAGATTCTGTGTASAACTDKTIFNWTGGSNWYLAVVPPTGCTTVTTLSGLTFNWLNGGGASANGALYWANNHCSWPLSGPQMRFTNSHIAASPTGGGSVFSNIAGMFGVIDHILYVRNSGNTGMFGLDGDRTNRGYPPWNQAVAWGTNQALYIETSTFIDNVGTNTEGPIDCYSGSRYVFRFSYVQGTHQGGCHGTDTDTTRSVMMEESYGNTQLNNNTSSINYTSSSPVRGGSAFIFGETYQVSGTGASWAGVELQCDRCAASSCTSPVNGSCPGWGLAAPQLYMQSATPSNIGSVTSSTSASAAQFCGPKGLDNLIATGNNSGCAALVAGDTASAFLDGGQSTTSAYPVRDQVGRVHTAAQGQALAPVYIWSMTPTAAGQAFIFPATSNIQECRDFYQQFSGTFTGACSAGNGVGVGTLAARPACSSGCTTGVGYWATDQGNWNTSGNGFGQGQLYVWNGTAWTLYYTPYTYPHPLAGGTPSATSTPILSPNNSQTGNSANSLQPPTLTFGNQGTSTSVTLPISINNCSTPNVAGCTGTGNLTLAATPLVISGTNAANFAFALGTCTPNQVIASGGSCSPTITFNAPAATGNSTATLTVNYANGTPSSTMTLTGTSATATALPACGSALTNNTFYQATANITCPGTAYTFGSGADVNLGGFTLTWNNAAQTTPTGAFLTGGFNGNITVHNGTISQGVGTNSQSTTYTNNFLAVIGPGAGNLNFSDNNSFFNLTFNYSFQYWAAINTLGPGTNGGNLVVHDVTINDSAVGTCASVGCRNNLQSTAIRQPGTVNQPATPTHYYNITVNGSAQGGLMAEAPGAVVEHNLVNIGNATGTNSNNFGIYAWGPVTVHDNIINIPLNAGTTGRGLAMQGINDGPAGSKSAFNNVIQAFALPNNSEYASNGNCAIGGSYGIQFDDDPEGPSINANSNTVTVLTNKCGGSGLRLTDTRLTTNTSTNNTYVVSRQTGAGDCTITTEADPNGGCAFGISIDGNSPPPTPPNPTAFTSTGDTFTADSGMILIGPSGAQVSTVVIKSPTFNKGSNPSPTWHTFWASNGIPGTVFVVDPTVGPGVSLTDTRILTQGQFQAPASFYVQWTQTITVQNASAAPISGATVSYAGALETDTCTTNASGKCSVVVTQNRLNNDTGANQIEVRNPYTRTVSASGFTTNTASGLTLTSPNSVTVTLTSGSTPAAAPTYSPVAGSYVGAQVVTMSSTTAGFTITYCFDTTNTCTPSISGSTFTVSSTGFLRAFANATGFTQSSTSSAQYTISATAPVFSPTAGAFIGPINVSLSATLGSVICYTTDGTTPATNGSTGCTAGTLFSSAIPLALNTTIRAIAGGTGVSDSAVAIGIFAIQGAAAPASFARASQIILNGANVR